MTQNLANKLIAYYEQHIEVVKGMDDVDLIIQYLKYKELQGGVCWVAEHLFNENVYSDEFIEKHCGNKWFWAQLPCKCTTLPEIIHALQIWVDILKTFKEI